MKTLCCNVLTALKGKTLATAESLTGGGIGASLTAIAGSSEVYKGGVISYTNEVKQKLLGVPQETLRHYGAVSEPVARAMVSGVRELLGTDVAVSVTGLAGPGGDDYGNPVGTVFIGYQDAEITLVRHCRFSGGREDVRSQTIETALRMILEHQNKKM